MVPNGERQRAEQGLRDALDRLDSRVNGSSQDDPLIPFAEALNWLYSLEEFHNEHLKANGVPDYYARRDRDPDGKVAAGVIYARGLVAHQLAAASELVAVFPSVFPSVFPAPEWRWRLFSDLPAPGQKERHHRDDKYRNFVERQPVLQIVRAAERFLTTTVKSYYP
jgi:hypothetical protein